MQVSHMTSALSRRRGLPPSLLVASLGSLAVAVIAFAVSFGLLGWTLQPLWTVSVLAVTAAIAERASVQLIRGVAMESSISNLLVLFSAVLFGPLVAMLVGAVSMLGAFRSPYLNCGSYTHTRPINIA